MALDDPTEYIAFGGAVCNRRLAAFLTVCGHDLGYNMSVIKGHTATSSSVSGPTHNGTDVCDLPPTDVDRKMRVIKENGGYPYHRLPADGFVEHIHMMLPGGAGMDPMARRQCTSYENKRNGLANNGPDRNPWRPTPDPPNFRYDLWLRDGKIDVAIKGINAHIKTWRDRIKAAQTRRAMLKSKKTYS